MAFSRGDFAQAARRASPPMPSTGCSIPMAGTEAGRELRLKQEAFLVSASLQDLLARHVREFGDLQSLGLRNAIHLNVTPSGAGAIELLRLLIDEHGLSWDSAWKITRQAISYTSTLMPEALETWPVAMFERLLPRLHLELIYQLNQHLAGQRARTCARRCRIDRTRVPDRRTARSPGAHGGAVDHRLASGQWRRRIAFEADGAGPSLPTSPAAARQHHNVTNGVTRRWLAQANPALAAFSARGSIRPGDAICVSCPS